MEETVFFHERPVRILRTERAERALAQRRQPLAVELELFFSCLLRKRVRFPDPGELEAEVPADPAAPAMRTADGRLVVAFRPVMSRHCALEEGHQLEAFPIAQPEPFVPRWARIDYHPRHGWQGEVGYAHDEPAA
jgi:hypothetical protein